MQGLSRALDILRAIGNAQSGLTLRELSTRLHIPVATTHRMLATLCAEGFVVRSPLTRRYSVGPSAFNLTRQNSIAADEPDLPEPLRRACVASGETIFLTELLDGAAIVVAVADGRQPLRWSVRLGQSLPLHAAPAARVLLLAHPETERAGLLGQAPYERFARNTLTGPAGVEAALQRACERGYDAGVDELDDDVFAVAAPVFDTEGRVSRGVGLAGPAQRLHSPSIRQAAARIVVELARDLAGSGESGLLDTLTVVAPS
jgi:IclR family acetate operon transcriptional repressor